MVVLLTFKLHNTVTTNLTSLYTNDVLSVLACVGRFGDHCNKTCPEGHYGIGCNNKCACDNNLCDKVLGCPIIATGIQRKRSKAIILFAFIYIDVLLTFNQML